VSRKSSAGLVIYRRRPAAPEVLLVHPGGPLWQSRDHGAWSIPKGELAPGEDPLEAARREVAEETGLPVSGDFQPLRPVRQSGGKTIHAWAVEADCDPARITSNTFALEWPPHSGIVRQFPEIDRAAWFALEDARERIIPGQRELLDQLQRCLDDGPEPSQNADGAPRGGPGREVER
jgi:predicted NUDIX family NTP pyrophosphohydrolase